MHFLSKIKYSFLLVFLLFIILFSYFSGFYVFKNSYAPKYSIGDKFSVETFHSYVINLEKDKTKYEHFLNHFKEILPNENLTRIDAIYGKNLSKDYIDQIVDTKKTGRFVGVGSVGCYLSHIEAWKRCLESSNEFCLVFEDDLKIKDDYKLLLKDIIKELIEEKDKWDILSFEMSHKGMPIAVDKIMDGKFSISYYLLPVTHTGMYMINKKAAKSLLDKSLPIMMDVDHFFTRTWEFDGIKFAGLEPRIAYQDELQLSSRTTQVDKSILKAKKKKSFIYFVFESKRGIIYFLHNLKLAIKFKFFH